MTNGDVYGKEVFLAVSEQPESWYEITEEEYEYLMRQKEEENQVNLDEFTEENQVNLDNDESIED